MEYINGLGKVYALPQFQGGGIKIQRHKVLSQVMAQSTVFQSYQDEGRRYCVSFLEKKVGHCVPILQYEAKEAIPYVRETFQAPLTAYSIPGFRLYP